MCLWTNTARWALTVWHTRTSPTSEHLNLLKIDALGLRTLGVIEDSAAVTSAEQLYALSQSTIQKVLDISINARMTR